MNDVKIIKHDIKKGSSRKTIKSSKKGDKLNDIILHKNNLKTSSSKKKIIDDTLEANSSIINYQSIYSYVKEMLSDISVKNIPSNELREFIKTLELELNDSKKNTCEEFMSLTLKNMAVFSVHNFCYTRALDILKEHDTRIFTIFKSLHELLNGYIREYFRI